MATLAVGEGQQYSTIGSAITASHDGDVILVQAGTYRNDFAQITDSITLQAVGGMVSMTATKPPHNSKGILTIGTPTTAPDVTINGFSFSGARISAAKGHNAAGIRYQRGNLTLNDDLFAHNQMGLLATPEIAGTGTITINASEFLDNGIASGHGRHSAGGLPGHNIYINRIADFTISNSISEGALLGHEIKSRALNTTIEGNLIYDGPKGTSSYDIDIPDGGNATIENNVIEQGPKSPNGVMIAYGEENKPYNPGTSLVISGNTILNDQKRPHDAAIWNRTTVTLTGVDNRVYGLSSAELTKGGLSELSGTAFLTSEPVLNLTPPWKQIAQTGHVDWFQNSMNHAGITVQADEGLSGTHPDAPRFLHGARIGHAASDAASAVAASGGASLASGASAQVAGGPAEHTVVGNSMINAGLHGTDIIGDFGTSPDLALLSRGTAGATSAQSISNQPMGAILIANTASHASGLAMAPLVTNHGT